MARGAVLLLALAAWLTALAAQAQGAPQAQGAGPTGAAVPADAPLPAGVTAVWDLGKAWRETTPTRERVCLNGLWRWQPADAAADAPPADRWGFFKVPGCWPGITDYMQKDSQTVHAHPAWQGARLGGVASAWYQREMPVPADWAGRRVSLAAEYVNSYAVVYVDGRRAGELRYPGGEVDLTAVCRPGGRHVLSLHVTAMPLKAVMLSYSDTAAAREVKGAVARRGLCGDVYLVGAPAGARVADVAVRTSVREGRVTFDAALENLAADARYALRARITDAGRQVAEFTSRPFGAGDLKGGRISFAEAWKPGRLWDIHTPGNVYQADLALVAAGGGVLDAAWPVRFGFREFRIQGRDFYLNGTRVFLSAVPLDNAQVGAALACYAAARESLERLRSFGINFVYTHNYGCEPGSHLAFDEVLRAADDAGMLVALSQPHFSHYDWKAPDAEKTNGYAGHAAFYVRAAGSHPSVVAYATSHNATASGEDMDPLRMGAADIPRDGWSLNNARLALRAEAVIAALDPGRIVYHHAGDIGALHASNFYPNFVPVQEMSDWFEPWAARGAKPVFLCEYAAPFSWDWAMYRGWYRGRREFGSAVVPWEFCLAEWNAQFLGDRAFAVSDEEKRNLRWEARQFRDGKVWHRWDYPHQLGSRDFDERYPVFARYYTDNWRAFRTLGVSAISPWEHGILWRLRDGMDRSRRRDLPTDWENLQRPGFSPDYLEDRYERMDLAYDRADWVPTLSAEAMRRNNMPLLAYVGGGPGRPTAKDHNVLAGETVEKQLIIINNSRRTVSCECAWSLGLPQAVAGARTVTVPTGEQERLALRFDLPAALAPGAYDLRATVRFSSGETQDDAFALHVLAPAPPVKAAARIALFDPRGETGRWLAAARVPCDRVDAGADLAPYDVLVIGKAALTAAGPGPDLRRVRDGLKVLVFEQASEVLEQRLGFRVVEYGLRQVFRRVPDHPLLEGLEAEHLCDWRGEATLLAPRLTCDRSRRFSGAPAVRWCGIEVTRVWRAGCRGSVASVLIEKPACGDFLPVVDGGYSLQYSPLMEYREGKGMVLFCQMDVTGRTETDPAAERLARNILRYVADWKPSPRRRAVYAGDPAGKAHLERAGVAAGTYDGAALAADQVLVVGPGGGRQLAPHAAAIGDWLKAGGRLLALGLDQDDARALGPFAATMKKAEHIAAVFEPFGAASPLAGVGPADVHNRDPREIPLVAGGAAVVGNGVLATAEGAGVVFCQLVPWQFDDARQYNLKRTYRRTSFLLARLLANMGVAAAPPVLERFVSPAGGTAGPSMVRNGDFAADGDGAPDGWVFSSSAKGAACRRERADAGAGGWAAHLASPPAEGDKPPSAMLAQHDLPVRKGQWYRVSLRARAERLEAPSVTVTLMNTVTWRSFFEYQQFRPGPEWQTFVFDLESGDTAEDRTRLQIWYDGAGDLWLADVRVEPIADPALGRWLEGLYLDRPEEWDDPYRFFRW